MTNRISHLCQAFLLTLLFTACNQNSSAPEPKGKPVEISARVARQTSDFAFGLLRNLEETQPANENIFVSPLSLHIALGMLANGAGGETAKEIIRTLKSEDSSIETLNEAYSKLLKALPEADSHVDLSISNSIWYRSGFDVKSGFKAVLAQIFQADIYAEDFGKEATVQKINQWAREKTNGKIPRILDQITPDNVMFLINALYFKGDWKYQFDKNKTEDWSFQLSGGNRKQVPMMFAEADFRTYDGDGFVAVELPYASGQYNLTLVLPSTETTVGELSRRFDADTWDRMQQSFSTRRTRVGFPKVTLQYEITLNRILQSMGMKSAFEPSEADLSGINDQARLFVSFVKQNTFLAVDEKGTEAAAVTTIGIELTSVNPGAPRTIVADRPFLFFISENTSNTILFTGRIMNP